MEKKYKSYDDDYKKSIVKLIKNGHHVLDFKKGMKLWIL